MRRLYALASSFIATSALANTAIETETAQLGKKGDYAFSQSIEFAKADDGSSGGTLTQFEYALTDRAEILIEPFFYEWEHADGEQRVGGLGDLEITPSYMAVVENGWVPAVVLATKVKVPTGSEKIGGTKKYDFYPYVILGQHFGGWTFNGNLGVNFARPPEGGKFERTTVWDAQVERQIHPGWTVFAEVFSAEEGVKTVSTAAQYQFTRHFNAFMAVGYTKEHEWIVRPGFNLEF